ncbi:MAG: hypothetical protein ACOCRK_00695 [bacterium]
MYDILDLAIFAVIAILLIPGVLMVIPPFNKGLLLGNETPDKVGMNNTIVHGIAMFGAFWLYSWFRYGNAKPEEEEDRAE